MCYSGHDRDHQVCVLITEVVLFEGLVDTLTEVVLFEGVVHVDTYIKHSIRTGTSALNIRGVLF